MNSDWWKPGWRENYTLVTEPSTVECRIRLTGPWIGEGTLVAGHDGTRIEMIVYRSPAGVLAGIAYWAVSICGAIVAFAVGEQIVAAVVIAVGLALLLEVRLSAEGYRELIGAIGRSTSVSQRESGH